MNTSEMREDLLGENKLPGRKRKTNKTNVRSLL
jgi:hypothetical protein